MRFKPVLGLMVIAATWLMAGSYLRRHAKMSLRSLVRRRARVILTATHWDVMFPLADIDLRVRRLALDTDPGWVPWLGRVVQLHFDD